MRKRDTKAVRKPDVNAAYWDMRDIAAYWGVTYETVRTYRSRGRGELPPNDATLGGSPVWRPATIVTFRRSGQGKRTDLACKKAGLGSGDAETE